MPKTTDMRVIVMRMAQMIDAYRAWMCQEYGPDPDPNEAARASTEFGMALFKYLLEECDPDRNKHDMEIIDSRMRDSPIWQFLKGMKGYPSGTIWKSSNLDTSEF